jgi:hypothetical protein
MDRGVVFTKQVRLETKILVSRVKIKIKPLKYTLEHILSVTPELKLFAVY